MALVLNDRVRETTSVVGTGAVTLLGAVTGFQSFSTIGNGNTTYYCISDQGGPNWEVGVGTYTSAGTTLARTTVLASSNGGALVSFTAGTKDVFVTYPSEKGVWYDASGNVLFTGATTISVTDNTDAALRITQLGTGNALVVEDSTNPDSTPFVITNNGSIIAGGLTGTYGVNFQSQNSYQETAFDSVLGSYLHLRRAANSLTSPSIVASGNILGELDFEGYDGSAYRIAASISAAVDGTPGTNDMPGRLVFSTTADGASSPTERLRIDNAGRVGIGGVAGSDTSFVIANNITGAPTSYGARLIQTVQSGVTTTAYGCTTQLSTQAASFTMSGGLIHFTAAQGTFGAGSTVTSQQGFRAESSLTGATNNYGFFGNIASGTGRYNLYMGGTADNYMAGSLGIGGVPSNQNSLTLAGTFKGSAGYSFPLEIVGTIDPTVASSAAYTFFGRPSVAAGTLPDLRYFAASQGGFTGTVTTQYGVMINASIIGATNNYAFYGAIPSGTGRYNLYMAGTASNYLGGPLITAGLQATSAAAPTIASATTIAPTTQIAFISGTTAIATITAPSPISLGGGQITLIPTGIFTTTTAGNIALASTAVVGKALIMTYDATTTKWYPSY